jgi:hypothetical protein
MTEPLIGLTELDEAIQTGMKDNGSGSDDPTGGRHINGGSITDALRSQPK